ncbi:MAG: hypothetical protein P8X80_04360 [Desulfobacterales bacterium]
MDQIDYFNGLMARTEELFYHELSDCAAWKTEFIGVDFIQSKDIKGGSPAEIIESCIQEITDAGLIKGASYSIGGQDILLYLRIQECIHVPKEVKLLKGGIEPYNCPIVNMVLDQLIEKLNFETTYVADLEVDPAANECLIKCAIFETADKIGNVCDWSDECRLIDENDQWKTVKC